jgi:glycosyltransferase involved in cell wall biosynthesis
MNPGRLRLVYVVDTMADVRMVEGFARFADVTVLAPDSLERVANYWPPRSPAAATLVRLPGSRRAFVTRAARWLRRHRGEFDVAVALDNLVAALGANLGRRLGGPPVVLQIGRPTLEYVSCQRAVLPFPKFLPRYLLARLLIAINERAAAAIGAVSQYCAAQCARHSRDARAVYWYGVDAERFRRTLTREEARARLGLPVDPPMVMLRSRLAPEKDPETFLRAVQELRRQGRRFTAVYMGGELDEMAAWVARTGVEVVARTPADVDEIPLWYMAADVNVQTSHAEGLGVSPLEALACATPVAVTDTGGLREVVDDGRVGALIAPRDHHALAHAVAAALDDPVSARAQADEGRARVETMFTADEAFAAWERLFRDASGVHADDRLRVLFVDHESRLSGGQRDLVDLVRALPRDRVDVHAAVPADGALADALRAHGATVHIVAMDERLRAASRWELARGPHQMVRHLAGFARAALALRRLSRRVRPDVVHTNSMKAHLLAIPAARAAGAPLVWHVRDIVEEGWLQRAFILAGRVAPARVVCLSEVAAAPFRRSGLGGKTRVVYNGIRLTPVARRSVAAARRRLGATNGEPVVGIVGQIAHWKGQDTFVEAAGLIAARVPDVRFAVVGACLFPQNEGDFAAAIRRRSTELGLDDRLVWTGSLEPIEPVMAALDVVVHASRLPEPFGRVIVEAMASGTPVVASERGAGPEIVTNEVGSLVAPDDPVRLAAAVEALLNDAGRDERRAAARARAAAFDIVATGAGVLAVYDELTSSAGRKGRRDRAS